MVVAAAPEPGMVVKAKGIFEENWTMSVRAPRGTRQLTHDFKCHSMFRQAGQSSSCPLLTSTGLTGDSTLPMKIIDQY